MYAIKNIKRGTLREGYYFSSFHATATEPNIEFRPLMNARFFGSADEALGYLCRIANYLPDPNELIVVEVEIREVRVVHTRGDTK